MNQKTGNVSIDVHLVETSDGDEALLNFIGSIQGTGLCELCELCDKLDSEYKAAKDVGAANLICRKVNAVNQKIKSTVAHRMDQLLDYCKTFGPMAKAHPNLNELTFFNAWFALRGGWR